MRKLLIWLIKGISLKLLFAVLLGSAILSFGIHNIHQRTGITEGGIIGLMLLIENWLGISPAYITPILDVACYLFAFKLLGGRFIKISAIATVFVSLFYKIWELFPPMLPDFSNRPIIASLLGAVFVGIGVGLVIRYGGSSSGDDALALTISKITEIRLSWCYLFTDITVLVLSLSYISIKNIIYSVITVTLSSVLVDIVKSLRFPKSKKVV